MNEDVEMVLEMAKEQMQLALEHLAKELVKLRAGKASPDMVNGVIVDYYGSMTPLKQVANVSTQDARTIAIQPWEKAMIGPIERAIMNANLGFNPDNNGEIIRINVPPLTEERRRGLVKMMNAEGEHARVSLRSARKAANDEFKKMEKDGLSEDTAKDAEASVQKLVDQYSKSIDELLVSKEKDIMTI